jgi:hypothetical protein
MKRKKLPLRKTEKELIAAFEQIAYEINMLKYCGNLLQSPKRPEGSEHAILMESFLIHARNLNSFFCGLERVSDKGKLEKIRGGVPENDVIVEEFFLSTPWEKLAEELLSEDLRNKINYQLAHISYERTISRADTWDYKMIQERLQRVLDKFISTVPLVKHHPELKELLEEPPGPSYFYP